MAEKDRSQPGRPRTAVEPSAQLDLTRLITENLSCGLFLIDEEGRILFVNPAGERLTGYGRDELLGELLYEKISRVRSGGRTAAPENGPLEKALQSGAALSKHEDLFVYRDRSFPVRCEVRPISPNESGACAVVEIQDLSREKEAEEHLRQEAGRSEVILRSITDGFMALDRKWRIIYINHQAEEVFAGLKKGAKTMLGKVFWDELPDSVGSEFEKQYHRAVREQKPVFFESFYPPLKRWFSVSAYPSPQGLSLFFHDVTARKRTEEALQEETARKTAILDSALDAIISMDSEGKIVDFNAAAERIFGYSATEVVGKTVAEMIIPERYREQHWRGLRHFQASGEGPVLGRRIEVEAMRADGREFPAELAISTTSLPDQPPFFTAYLRDITQAKVAEQALQEAGERFRFMAESVPQKIVTTTPKGEIDYVNRLWMEFTGLSFDEIKAWGWTQCIHPDDLEENTRRWQHSIATGEPFEFQHRFRRHDGVYRWHLTRARAMRNEEGEIVMWVGSNTEIHEQKRAERKLEKMVEERTAELQETVGELEAFSYSISHDMRSPLRAMQSFATILEEECAEQISPEGKDYVRRIINAANRMDRLIQDVLTYSRIPRAKLPLKPVDAAPLLSDIIESYPALQPPHADFIVEGQLPTVLGYEAGLIQCFSNLLSNAVKFVPPAVKPRVRVWAEKNGGRVRLFFADNGIGMKKGEQGRIFEIFNRLGRGYEGTGIGLAIVQKAVSRMDGKVGVESELGKGSTFWLELRVAEKQ